MTSAAVELRNATLGYPGRPVLHQVSLAIARGEFLALVGPNGGGKTTLLRSLVGLLPLLAGSIVYGSDRLRRPWAYVPQRDALDPVFPLRAVDVVTMGVSSRLPPLVPVPARFRQVAASCLAQVGLADRARDPFQSLSVGQRQRVLIARALAVDPEVIALDEPTAGADPDAEIALDALISDLNRTRGITVITSTHGLQRIRSAVHTVVVVKDGRALRQPGGEDPEVAGGPRG